MTTSKPPQPTASVARYSEAVRVTNGGDIVCAANEAAKTLRARGYTVVMAGNGNLVETTIIFYPEELSALAKKLHNLIPVAHMIVRPSIRQVELVIGSNGATIGRHVLGMTPPKCDAAN